MFSQKSIELSKSISKEDRKKQGIYFTPNNIVKQTLLTLPKKFKPKTILEPSCGSGEFLTELKNSFQTSFITGIEYNKDIYNKIKDLKEVEIINNSFLKNMI